MQFQKRRRCTDQIFALRNVIEQTLEWNYPLYMDFINFKKAFDSNNHDTLWKILRDFGVSPKIISLIENFYNHFECSVLSNSSSEWFLVKSGVRQGCILSPILFFVIIDWVMRKTTSDKPSGIQWTLLSQLEEKLDHLLEKTDRLDSYAKETGLTISTTKTQVMGINTTPTAPVTFNGEPLEFVEDFTYLGSLISKDNGAPKDIKARLGKAHCAFTKLQNIWKSSQFTSKTKIIIYNVM